MDFCCFQLYAVKNSNLILTELVQKTEKNNMYTNLNELNFLHYSILLCFEYIPKISGDIT